MLPVYHISPEVVEVRPDRCGGEDGAAEDQQAAASHPHHR